MSSEEDMLGHHGVSDDDNDEDQDLEDDFKHNRLLDAITALDGKKKSSAVQRTEASTKVSEFHMSSGNDKVKLHELVGALRDSAGHGDLKKQLNRIQKSSKVLSVPLPKVQQDRIQRSTLYEETAKEVSKWDTVVQNNRKAEQLQFPLQKPNVRLQSTGQLISRFQPRTPLELEVAALLHGSDHVFTKEKPLSRAEERAMRAMSIEEAKERRAELQKYRALLSYKEAKARRQNKIKSKKYHRVLRKERQKEEKRGLDEMQKNDPEAFAEYLQKVDRDRIKERVSLKHKGGSRFMQRQKLFGKYDKDARQAVQDMLQKNQELTKKMRAAEESEEDSEEEDGVEVLIEEDGQTSEDKSNPWMAPVGIIKSSVQTKPSETQTPNKEKAASAQSGKDEPETHVETQSDNNSAGTKEVHSNASIEKSESINLAKLSELVKEDQLSKQTQERESSSDGSASDSELLKDDSDIDLDELFALAEKQQKLNKKPNRKSAKRREKEREKKEEEIRKRIRERKEAFRKKGLEKKMLSKQADSIQASQQGPVESEDSSDEEEEEPTKVGQSSLMEPEGQAIGDEMITASLKRKRTLEDLEEEWSDSEEVTGVPNEKPDDNPVSGNAAVKAKPAEVQVDPSKLMTVEHRIRPSHLPSLVEDEDDGEGRDLQQHMTIAEAFAADDVVDEFAAEKKAVMERDKPKDIDLTLPGWGDWGGTGIRPSKKKKKRFMIKAPPAPPRRDANMDTVIISETKDRTIAKHQVSHLPFPFTSVHQFESSVRAPIGNTWNPETAFKKLIRPKVTTRKGVVIDPISKEETFKNQKVSKEKDSKSKHGKGKKGKHNKGGRNNKKQNKPEGGKKQQGGGQGKKTKSEKKILV